MANATHTDPGDRAAAAFCETLMRSVVAGAPELVRRDIDRTVELLRAEAKRFLIPAADTAGDYRDARAALLARSIHEGYVIGLVAANVIAKLREARA